MRMNKELYIDAICQWAYTRFPETVQSDIREYFEEYVDYYDNSVQAEENLRRYLKSKTSIELNNFCVYVGIDPEEELSLEESKTVPRKLYIRE